MNVDIASNFYPYINTQPSYIDLSEAVSVPRKICDYLIDAPKGAYTPPDNNDYSRCRLWKYLYYDTAKPLNEPLPTISQKMDVVFNPDAPDTPPTERGYRLIPQIWTKQSQTAAQTQIYVYMGRTIPSNDELKIVLGVNFFIWTHYQYEANTRTDAYSRAFAIEQAIIESLHGVNMTGIGTFSLSKAKHPDCGSRTVFDGDTNVGRELVMALEFATTAPSGSDETENMPFIDKLGKVRLA